MRSKLLLSLVCFVLLAACQGAPHYFESGYPDAGLQYSGVASQQDLTLVARAAGARIEIPLDFFIDFGDADVSISIDEGELAIADTSLLGVAISGSWAWSAPIDYEDGMPLQNEDGTFNFDVDDGVVLQAWFSEDLENLNVVGKYYDIKVFQVDLERVQ